MSEPYSMDFGDGAIVAWLRANLTDEEWAAREDAWQRYARVDPLCRFRFSSSRFPMAKLRVLLLARKVLWPWRRWRLRAVRVFDELAEERGGPRPGLSWKVRTEFGTSAGGACR